MRLLGLWPDDDAGINYRGIVAYSLARVVVKTSGVAATSTWLRRRSRGGGGAAALRMARQGTRQGAWWCGRRRGRGAPRARRWRVSAASRKTAKRRRRSNEREKREEARDLDDKYALGEELDRGEFGVTYLCTEVAMGARMACRSISKRKLRTPVDEGGRALGGGDHAPHAPAHKHRQPQLCEGGELFNRMVARGHYTKRAAAVSRTIVEVVQVPVGTTAQISPNSRGTVPVNPVTPVHQPYLGVQHVQQQQAGLNLAFQPSSSVVQHVQQQQAQMNQTFQTSSSAFGPREMNFLGGGNMSYTQLLMAASQEGGIGGSQHSGQQQDSGGRGFNENDMYMLTERYGRLQQQNDMGQTTERQQAENVDVGAEGFPSWSWDGNTAEGHPGGSYQPRYRGQDSDDDDFEFDEGEDDLDDDLDVDADEAAAGSSDGVIFAEDMSFENDLGDDTAPAGSSHGPSFTDEMSVDGYSVNGEQAYTHGKNKNVCGCDDQQEGGPVQQENIEHLSQEDILMFLENDSVSAAQAQTCSQEVRIAANRKILKGLSRSQSTARWKKK